MKSATFAWSGGREKGCFFFFLELLSGSLLLFACATLPASGEGNVQWSALLSSDILQLACLDLVVEKQTKSCTWFLAKILTEWKRSFRIACTDV